jgi:flagellar basal-body rod protein FlgC
MSLFNVFDIAGSGMSAQSVRLNVTASNMANAESVSSSIDETYRARHPVFETVLDELQSGEGGTVGGVRVLGVVESDAPLRQEHRPDHPLANEEGYVYMPNVSLVEEMANMIAASRSYQSNVEMMNASKQMLLHTLSLGQ